MTPSTATGYSGTPLARKLGHREGSIVFVAGAPGDYTAWLQPLPPGVVFLSKLGATADLVHFFEAERESLAKLLVAARRKIRPGASIWVSWPKKSSKVPTTITEDTVRELALPLGLVDIKVCAVTEVWSGPQAGHSQRAALRMRLDRPPREPRRTATACAACSRREH